MVYHDTLRYGKHSVCLLLILDRKSLYLLIEKATIVSEEDDFLVKRSLSVSLG